MIFAPKGWLGPKALTKQLKKYAMFMTNTSTMDFTICQRTARKEFITHHGTGSEALRVKITTKQNEFLGWLLKKLRYVDNNNDNEVLGLAANRAVMDYERAIMYHVGARLWPEHRTAFRDHKKYYCNQLIKPFSIVTYKLFTRE